MKVTTEHFTMIKEQLTQAIDGQISQGKVTDRKQFFSEWEAIYKNYTETRKIWDLYWASGGAEWIKKAFDGNPYGAPYNDSHLSTALKKAYNDIHKESIQ